MSTDGTSCETFTIRDYEDQENKYKFFLPTFGGKIETEKDSAKMIWTYREMMEMNNYKISPKMPCWFLRAPYIRYGYRYHKNMDVKMCSKSLFMLHN